METLRKKVAFVVAFFLNVFIVFSQGVTLDNTGGKITNYGTLRIRAGQVKNLNDTLDGRVEYTSICPAFTQEVPNIVYNQLVISGVGLKVIDSLRKVGNRVIPLIARDSLLLIDSARINLLRNDINAFGPVANSSYIYGDKEIRLVGLLNQDIWGNGNFPILNLDNPNGATVIRSGGFRIDQKLILTRGEFRNSLSNNFSLGDSVRIIRYVGASISNLPNFGRNVDVEYRGNGAIASGPELPDDSSILKNLVVRTTGGLYLTKNTFVNDSLVIASTIYTEPNDSTRFTLTHTSPINPIFENLGAEIDGSYRRTNIKTDSSKIIFNNQYTYLIFPDASSLGDAREITMRVKPRTFPPYPLGDQKVQRQISMYAKDRLGNPVGRIYPIFGYGWRHSTDSTINETNGLDVYSLRLQWWDGTNWVNVGEEDLVQIDTANGWAFNIVKNSAGIDTGEFAIGLSFRYFLTFSGKAILEGAWRKALQSMGNELQQRNLIPKTPPDIFPYNLDPERDKIYVENLPDSVVDWVVLEFRRTLTDNKPIRYTAFLKTDGRIVGRNGEYPLTSLQIPFCTTDYKYYIAVLHRNHLGVVTEEKVDLRNGKFSAMIDFTKPDLVMGRESSLKPLARTNDGLIFGLFAGDVDANGIVNLFDQNQIWVNRDFEGYLIWDTSMDGIVTTRDLNYSINNRTRRSLIP
ncbi:MAG: hypothetical protein ACUVQ1_08435 [Candidatus Kapaibacteriales bacterium]